VFCGFCSWDKSISAVVEFIEVAVARVTEYPELSAEF
jgi:hypothetical protein